jgi:hypothetical protein
MPIELTAPPVSAHEEELSGLAQRQTPFGVSIPVYRMSWAGSKAREEVRYVFIPMFVQDGELSGLVQRQTPAESVAA